MSLLRHIVVLVVFVVCIGQAVVAQAQQATLTVTLVGGGTVTTPQDGKINCGAVCAASYPIGTVVGLLPVSNLGFVFVGFSGPPDCLDGSVTMTTDKTCTATFGLLGGPQATLTVTPGGSGGGTVTIAPPGLVCGPNCVATYPAGTGVTLSAAPAAGSAFSGFGGSPDCLDGVVTLSADTLCTATFSDLQLVGVSVGPGGVTANGTSLNPSISGDGRFVVFESGATNLGGGCATVIPQIFLVDRTTGIATCLSVAPGGAPGNGASALPRISGDGLVVAFQSAATNLVLFGCTAGGPHVFARDLATGAITCLSVTAAGAPGDAASSRPAISEDGRFVAFESIATNLGCGAGVSQVLLRDRVMSTTTCVSLGFGGLPGDVASARAAINGDGSVVAFQSSATNLVPVGCTAGGGPHVFVRTGGVTSCVSVAPDGTAGNAASQGPALSTDGALVAFESVATNLTANCQNGLSQVFVRDRLAGTTRCVSVTPDGLPGDGASTNVAISGDGSVVAFSTTAENLVGGAGAPAFAGPAAPEPPAANGLAAQIAMSGAVRGNVQRLTDANGSPGNGPSRQVALSRDGRKVALDSEATNLRSGDDNGQADVFALELESPSGPVVTAQLVAAVLPASRSVQVGTTATAFASMINIGGDTALGCSLAPLTALAATFMFQTTDPATNQVTGTLNTPVDIPANGTQSFVFALAPTGPIAPTDVQLSFACANRTPAPSTPGLNTLLFSASTTPIPDIVALVATVTNNGIVTLSGVPGNGVFSVATVNLGAGGPITVSVDTGSASLPLSLAVCQTNPATGACLGPAASSVTTQIDANATPTFGVFVGGAAVIPFNPATNRIFVRFLDAGAVTRGATSVAVRTP